MGQTLVRKVSLYVRCNQAWTNSGRCSGRELASDLYVNPVSILALTNHRQTDLVSGR